MSIAAVASFTDRMFYAVSMYFAEGLSFVEEIVTIILNTFKQFLADVGSGIVDLFDSLVLVKDGSGQVTGLTALATWFLVFGAIGMAWGIVMVLFRKLRRG